MIAKIEYQERHIQNQRNGGSAQELADAFYALQARHQRTGRTMLKIA
jgi:hypothetical protein